MNCGPLLLIPAGGSGNFDLSGQEDLSPPSRCPGLHPDAEPGTGILNRDAEPGQAIREQSGQQPHSLGLTRWTSSSPGLLVPHPRTTWQRSNPAIHTPPKNQEPGTAELEQPPHPPPRWNASESPVIARRCPQDISSTKKRHPKGGVGLKSALRESGDFPTG